MRKKTVLLFSIIALFFNINGQLQAQTRKVSGIYGGGPIYMSASKTIPELRNSGFTSVIVWTIHIDAKGNLNFNMEFPIVTDGKYVGATKYPDFPNTMVLLKTPPTSVTRLEFSLSAWESPTFQNIKDLITSQGTGPTSILYRNFKALKDSIPVIDALNFDDEKTYDVTSSVNFAVMLFHLGYKVALCPYTQSGYWKSVASQTNSQCPGCVDFVFLQCYSGGAGNNPGSWNFNGVPVYPGLWDKDYSPNEVKNKMVTWKNQYGSSGGFIWLYDDFYGKDLTKQYAAALNDAFAIGTPEKATSEIPLNGETNISDTVTLSWSAGSYAQSHDVYLGILNPPEFKVTQTEVKYCPGKLASDTRYYWRIDEKNFFGVTTGTLWSFTTAPPTSVWNIVSEKTGISTLTVYPNPFKHHTSIKVTIPREFKINASVLNQYGQEVVCLTRTNSIMGENILTWRGENRKGQEVSPGLYILQIKTTDVKGHGIVKNSKIFFLK